jgi:hypothetical protein
VDSYHGNTSGKSDENEAFSEPFFIGKKRPSKSKLIQRVSLYREHEGRECCSITMKRGATIQLTTTLKPICFQMPRWPKTSCNVSYRTLQRMGYIMTSRPIAADVANISRRPIFSWRLRRPGRGFLTDWNGYIEELALLEGRTNPGNEVAKDDADGHGQKDPKSKKPVQPAQRLEGGGVRV